MRELQLDLDAVGVGGRRAALEAAMRTAIRSGRLNAGVTLPSTRALAADLTLSRSTVVAAYEQLTAEGYLHARRGSATVVAPVRTSGPTVDEIDIMGPTPEHDFRPGAPDPSSFPRALWQRSLRTVFADAPDSTFGYPDPRGVTEVRAALADYLGRTRTLQVDASSVRIYGGFSAALGFIGEALRRRGITRIGVEDPGFPFHVDILRLTGLTTVPIRVDSDGIDVDSLVAADVGAVLTTPAHQYPTGATLTPERRARLVDWANDTAGWVIEDDYDGEFRYDRRPIGALQGLDPERVIYSGTASKSIGAALRLSWLVVPTAFRADLLHVTHLRAGVSAIDQFALADLIGRGGLDRHVRHMRAGYGARREQLRSMLGTAAPWLDIAPTAAGLHLMATISRDDVDEAAVLSAAEAASVGLLGLRTHHRTTRSPAGFPIGFSRPSEHQFPTALERLADVLRSI